eukprot:13082836-Ditylum_brightwellii.AAC.1
MKTCVCCKECEPKETKESGTAHENYSKRGGKGKAKHKASKNTYHDWDQKSPQCHSDCKGHTYHEREYKFCESKKVLFSSGKAKSCEALSDGNKDLHAIIDEKNAAFLDLKEKKELNKVDALSILSNSIKDKYSDINSRVSDTSNEVMDTE